MNDDLSRLCFLSAALALSTAACVNSTGGGSSGGGSGGSMTAGSGGSTTAGSGGGAACQPATLVGATWTVAGGWKMAAIDPGTFAVTELAPMANPMGLQQGGSAYDPAAKQIYMLGEDAASQPTVLTIDGLTGATITTVSVDDPHAANPDVVGGGAIRIVHQTTPGNFESATLNPITGAITGLAGLSYSGFSADHGFDPGTNRLFEIGNLNGTGNLLTIDATTGMVISNIVTADAHFGTVAVNGAGELLGLHGTMTVWHVARLNLTTGAITDLTPITLSAVAAGMATFDPCTDRIYMITPDGLLVVDATLGTALPLVALTTSFANIEAVW